MSWLGKTHWWRLGCLLVSLMLLHSCQSLQQVASGKVSCGQSSRGQWYDYYRSGLACMDISDWARAETELTAALLIRNTDKRRAYSKGMHWVTNYFPNRELGITQYHLHQFALAEQSLTRSLAQFPSTKAEYYLNHTRRNMPSWRSKDRAPPMLVAAQKNADVLVLELSDDSFIEQININGVAQTWQDIYTVVDAQISIQRAKSTVKLSYPIDAQTQAAIVIEAIDIFNRRKTIDLSYYLDASPPQLSQLKITKAPYDQWQVSGLMADRHSGLKTLLINGQSVYAHSPKAKALKQVDIDYLTSASHLTLTATDFNGNVFDQRIDLNQRRSLELRLKPLPAYTQQQTVLLEGQVISGIKVEWLLVNGTQVPLSADQRFSYPLKLTMAKSLIDIEVANQNERIRQKHQVTLLAPDHLPQAEKLKVALFEFECEFNNGIWCDQQQSRQLHQMISQKKRFNLVAQADLAPHINQIKRCAVGLIEQCTSAALGLIQPNTALVGQLSKRNRLMPNGSRIKGEEAYVRMIDPTTGQLLIAFDAYIEQGANQAVMASINQQLLNKIHEKFPITASRQLTLNHHNISAEFAHRQWLWPNMPVKLFADDQACAVGKIEGFDQHRALAVLARRCPVKPGQRYRLVTM